MQSVQYAEKTFYLIFNSSVSSILCIKSMPLMAQIFSFKIMPSCTHQEGFFHNFQCSEMCNERVRLFVCLLSGWGTVVHLMLHILIFYFQKHSCQNSSNVHKSQNLFAYNPSYHSIAVYLDKGY